MVTFLYWRLKLGPNMVLSYNYLLSNHFLKFVIIVLRCYVIYKTQKIYQLIAGFTVGNCFLHFGFSANNIFILLQACTSDLQDSVFPKTINDSTNH